MYFHILVLTAGQQELSLAAEDISIKPILNVLPEAIMTALRRSLHVACW